MPYWFHGDETSGRKKNEEKVKNSKQMSYWFYLYGTSNALDTQTGNVIQIKRRY